MSTTASIPLPRTTTVAATGPAGVRASDDERAAVVARLHAAVGEGRLQLSECDDRVAAAYATTYCHELPALLTDLPDPGVLVGGPRSGAPTWTDVWTSAVWRARTTLLGDATAAPTPAQNRTAALLVALTLLWFLLCALLGAGLPA